MPRDAAQQRCQSSGAAPDCSLLVVFAPSQRGVCWVGDGVPGPCVDTKDVCVEQAPAGRTVISAAD